MKYPLRYSRYKQVNSIQPAQPGKEYLLSQKKCYSTRVVLDVSGFTVNTQLYEETINTTTDNCKIVQNLRKIGLMCIPSGTTTNQVCQQKIRIWSDSQVQENGI